MPHLLEIQMLSACIDETPLLRDVSLAIEPGSVHALMGPNGSGKSTLSHLIMGHPAYTITQGKIVFKGEDITGLSPDKRAKKRIFLSFQHPYEVEGIPLKDFLRHSYNAWYAGTEKQIGIKAFREHVRRKQILLGIEDSFLERPLNVGFSGGEKKRAEMLQMAVLEPELLILDEVDSGLDVDALKSVCHAITTIKQACPSMGILLVTHYQRILHYIIPDKVHILKEGSIVRSGDASLAASVEEEGYAD